MEQKHLFYIRYALRLGERGRLTSPPNPWVGAVVVRDDAIVGEGYHVAPGKPHAEIVALEAAGAAARGATIYTTLEPCAHTGRTGPCTEALIKAGVKRVIFPLLDPDPLVAGKGQRALEEGGVEVIAGIGKEEAARSLAPYLHHRETGRPYVVCKIAQSLDGKVAAADGSSQWITGEAARKDSHYLRAASQAIMVGSQTVLQDNPQLTVRGIEEPHNEPLKIVCDRRGRVQRDDLLTVQGSLDEVLDELGKKGVLQLLVEGGPQLQSSFLEGGYVNRYVVYIGACLLGEGGVGAFPHLVVKTIQDAKRWSLDTVLRFGESVRLDFYPFS